MIKRVRIFAGPNGSGKSSLKELVGPIVKISVYVNADEILYHMHAALRLDFSDFR